MLSESNVRANLPKLVKVSFGLLFRAAKLPNSNGHAKLVRLGRTIVVKAQPLLVSTGQEEIFLTDDSEVEFRTSDRQYPDQTWI